MEERCDSQVFCRAYLRTMDPERAAAMAGGQDGFALLEKRSVRRRLEEMRTAAAKQLRREDVLRQLAQLAFCRANDAVKLALRGPEADLEGLDLSAVAECKVTDKSVEVKLVDRVRALETLGALLENGDGDGAKELYQCLAAAAGEDQRDGQ